MAANLKPTTHTALFRPSLPLTIKDTNGVRKINYTLGDDNVSLHQVETGNPDVTVRLDFVYDNRPKYSSIRLAWNAQDEVETVEYETFAYGAPEGSDNYVLFTFI